MLIENTLKYNATLSKTVDEETLTSKMFKTTLLFCMFLGFIDGIPLSQLLFDSPDGYKLPWMDQFLDPEIKMTMEEAVKYHGYPFEEYTIHSPDGYYTQFHRIPYGKKNTATENRPPVFLMHGLSGMSSAFIANTPDKNIPYVLAEEGYDVWLGNVRGNDYSRKHDKYTTEDKEFWMFTWHEMAYYDVPLMIDFIIEKTGYKQVYYIGASMGTTVGFAMLASRPEYNQKIKGFYALAPVAYLNHVEGLLKTASKNIKIIETLANSQKLYEYRQDNEIVDNFFSKTTCDLPYLAACKLASGADALRLNITRTPVLAHFALSSTSMQTLYHYAQVINSGKFQLYDYGKTKNVELYGQPTPPEYPLSNITAPVALFHAVHDFLSDPKDVALLRSKISSPILRDYLVPDPKFLHMEFGFSFNIQSLVLDPLLVLMKKQDQVL